MAGFNKMLLTKKGEELLADIISTNSKINFTKLVTSSTIYTNEQISGLVELENIKQESLISKISKVSESVVQIEAAIDNLEVEEEYRINSIGLYAEFEGNEILYSVASMANENESIYMPVYDNLVANGVHFKLLTAVSNSENVSLIINSIANVTVADFEEYKEKVNTKFKEIDDVFGVDIVDEW